MNTIKELFTSLFHCETNDIAVVMPLTTVIKAEEPEHVIGFAWECDGIHVVTLPNREWETTAQFTGMTSELYLNSMVEDIKECKEFMEILDRPVAAYAKGCLIAALKSINLYAEVIGLSEALATSVRPKQNKLKNPDLKDISSFIKWLNKGKPLVKATRYKTLELENIHADIDRNELPVLGSNLIMDRAILDKVWTGSYEMDVEKEDAEDTDINPFDAS